MASTLCILAHRGTKQTLRGSTRQISIRSGFVVTIAVAIASMATTMAVLCSNSGRWVGACVHRKLPQSVRGDRTWQSVRGDRTWQCVRDD